MKYYDDLIDESFLLLRDEEQILTINSSVQDHVADILSTLYGGWRISPVSVLHSVLSGSPVPEVVAVGGIELTISDALQILMSYKAFAQYPTITDLASSPVTDLTGEAITELSAAIQELELIRERGVGVVEHLLRTVDTSPSLGVFAGILLAMNNATNDLWDGMDPYYEFITDEAGDFLTDLDSGSIRSLLLKTILYLTVDRALIANTAIQETLSDSPLLNRVSNILTNDATQLLPTDRVQFAGAILIAVANALQEQISTEPSLPFTRALLPNTAIQQQITDAITTATAHALITGNALTELIDDTAYLARALTTTANNALQELTSDTLTVKFVANLIADDALNNISQRTILLSAAYAVLLNTATQVQVDDGIIIDITEFVMSLNDAVQTIPDISPTLTAIFRLLIDDAKSRIITDDAYIARTILFSLSDSLQELDSDGIYFGQALALAIQDALQTIDTTLPGVTIEGFVSLVREVLARGYYFFKAKDKKR